LDDPVELEIGKGALLLELTFGYSGGRTSGSGKGRRRSRSRSTGAVEGRRHVARRVLFRLARSAQYLDIRDLVDFEAQFTTIGLFDPQSSIP
jgi:hypothetical protein